MEVKETIAVKRDIYVARCIQCNSADVKLNDCGYNTFNIGGGRCENCGFSVQKCCDADPKPEDLALTWNSANCTKTLIEKEKEKIEIAKNRINILSTGE